jgi:hypothetical protein
MPPSSCPSTTDRRRAAAGPARGLSVGLAAALLPLAGCPGDDAVCGPGDAPARALTAAAGAQAVGYGALRAGANNDCPTAGTPAGVVSLTIAGGQVEPAGAAVLTLCLPRPDRIAVDVAYPLSPDVQPVPADADVQLVDLQADLGDGCRWTLDDGGPLAATARFFGLCRHGVDPAGFALTLAGTATVVETCPGQPDLARTVTLAGTVAVAAD